MILRHLCYFVSVLLDLLLLITNWSCDVDICVERSIDPGSKWIAALIIINPVYPFRVALYHYNRAVRAYNLLVNHIPVGREAVPAKLYSDYLRKEVMTHVLRLHVVTKFFPFGQNP